MEREINKQLERSRVSNSGKLDEALDRVYERYGTNLSEFFRDAYKEAARSLESDDRTDNKLET